MVEGYNRDVNELLSASNYGVPLANAILTLFNLRRSLAQRFKWDRSLALHVPNPGHYDFWLIEKIRNEAMALGLPSQFAGAADGSVGLVGQRIARYDAALVSKLR